MTPLMILSIAGVFVSVILITWSAAALLFTDTTAGQRLRRATATASVSPTVLPELVQLQPDTASGAVAQLEKMVPRSPKEMSRLRARFTRAGIKWSAAPVLYSISEILLPLLLVVPPLLLLQGAARWLGVGFGGIIGYFIPGLVLEHLIRKRQRVLSDALPDALDLLVVCMEAGSGLDQALLKTSEEIGIAYPDLGEELRLVITEIRAGKTRLEAFKSLAQRTKVDDIRSLVAMLAQTDRFGTSVGQALRTHAETSRTKRRQRAEENAQKIGVKLVFPLVLFFFPALYVVVLGPAVIQFIRMFGLP
jgi:tight adherence protein C